MALETLSQSLVQCRDRHLGRTGRRPRVRFEFCVRCLFEGRMGKHLVRLHRPMLHDRLDHRTRSDHIPAHPRHAVRIQSLQQGGLDFLHEVCRAAADCILTSYGRTHKYANLAGRERESVVELTVSQMKGLDYSPCKSQGGNLCTRPLLVHMISDTRPCEIELSTVREIRAESGIREPAEDAPCYRCAPHGESAGSGMRRSGSGIT